MPGLKVIVEPGKQNIVTRRDFDAPRELVFQAHVDPDLIPRWWGPAKYKTVVEKLEPRTGGSWRVVSSSDDGAVFPFSGVFHEVTSPERMTQTFEFEPMAGHVSLNTATLEELGKGRTRVITVSTFQSVEDRDGMVQSGMESGLREGYERLDALLATRISR